MKKRPTRVRKRSIVVRKGSVAVRNGSARLPARAGPLDGTIPLKGPAFEKWSRVASDFGGASVESPRVPLQVLWDEAVDLAHLLRDTWDGFPGVDGKVVTPGFSGLLRRANVATELLELVAAIQHADTSYRLTEARGRAPMPEAQQVLSELRAALAWVAREPGAQKVREVSQRLGRIHGRARSLFVLAAALCDYAELAERQSAKLHVVAGFDRGLVREARALAAALREHHAEASAHTDRRKWREARDRLVLVLGDRVAEVRLAARYLFRHHPELLRRATSAYERNRKRKRKAKAKAAK
jgi:hypothetical protein